MKNCNHSHWFGLTLENNDITISQSDRATILLHDLPYFESQRPSLFVLVGSRAKALALKEFVSGTDKKLAAKRGCGEIHLHIDPSTAFSDRPILFADGDFPAHPRPTKNAFPDKCHAVSKGIIPGPRGSIVGVGLQHVADQLYSTLLSPHTDVFCFFAADLGGLEAIARRVVAWLNVGHLATSPAAALPHIVIVTEFSASESESVARDRFIALLATESRLDVFARFAGIRVIALLPASNVSAQARHRRLKEGLMAASDQVRSARADSLMLFAGHHFAAFLGHTCSHFADGSTEPFNFIRTARLNNPPAADLKDHLANFLQKISTVAEMRSAVSVVASSLLLDNYPPDMHREWDHIRQSRGLIVSQTSNPRMCSTACIETPATKPAEMVC